MPRALKCRLMAKEKEEERLKSLSGKRTKSAVVHFTSGHREDPKNID